MIQAQHNASPQILNLMKNDFLVEVVNLLNPMMNPLYIPSPSPPYVTQSTSAALAARPRSTILDPEGHRDQRVSVRDQPWQTWKGQSGHVHTKVDGAVCSVSERERRCMKHQQSLDVVSAGSLKIQQ